jgi:hypothetical protein
VAAGGSSAQDDKSRNDMENELKKYQDELALEREERNYFQLERVKSSHSFKHDIYINSMLYVGPHCIVLGNHQKRIIRAQGRSSQQGQRAGRAGGKAPS